MANYDDLRKAKTALDEMAETFHHLDVNQRKNWTDALALKMRDNPELTVAITTALIDGAQPLFEPRGA